MKSLWIRGLALSSSAVVLMAGGFVAGCSSFRSPPESAPPSTNVTPSADSARAAVEEPGLLELCRLEPNHENALDETRRRLQETFCGATLWFDGLFGGRGDVANARSTSGRVELSAVHSEYHGFEPDGRLRLRYDLPTLERRLNLFLGRTDEEGFISDRDEGFAVRPSTLDRTAEAGWLAGTGYSPPGQWSENVDFRVGGRVRLSPGVFAQTRLMRNVRVTDTSLWRLRQTFFWESADGLGTTTSIDYDRVLTPNVLAHWNNRGTVSEVSEGLEWRSAVILYHNLGSRRAVAGEIFARGATSAQVPFQEWGTRAIYRQPVFRPFLFGEFVVGYSWPRYELMDRRNGSPMLGLGTELLFGRHPP